MNNIKKKNSYKQRMPRINKEFLELNKKDNPIEKWAEDCNTDFTLEDIQMANKLMERSSTSLAARER